MRIPYVIDNQTYRLADVLNALLSERAGHSLDIATAYFNIGGYRLLRERLASVRSFRLLLGFEPQGGAHLGLRPDAKALHALLRGDLEREPFNEDALRLVEDLIAFLRQPNVSVRLYDKGLLHAKAYLFYGDKGAQASLFDRFLPLVGIVGSSNFTGPGLTTNKELNLAHKTLLDSDEVDVAQAPPAAQRLRD